MRWLLVPALIFSGMLSALAQGEGSIRGIVVNQEGSLVRGATVYPSSTTDRPLGSRLLPSAETDERGHFAIENVPFDEY